MEREKEAPMLEAQEHYKEQDVCDAAQVIIQLPQPIHSNDIGMEALYFILRKVWTLGYNQGYASHVRDEASSIFHNSK